MKLIPFALIFALAIFCSTIRNKIAPTPTPLPTPTPVAEATDLTKPSSNERDHQHPIPKTISGGVLNEKATSLPQPSYPAAARAVRASGEVSVQVLISEDGKVLDASAISGHPLLKAAAVQAARKAVFEPRLLSGIPVKVSGTLNYSFQP